MSTVIAIDGPSASGKGSLARALAAQLGFACLDTGKLYRWLALEIDSRAPDDDDATLSAVLPAMVAAMTPAALGEPRLLTATASRLASHHAARPAVRACLLDFQRSFAARPPGGAPGAVLDGRDIGTVVWPQAECKLFVTASLAVRAKRRYEEMVSAGVDVSLGEIAGQMDLRDRQDRGRSVAPCVPAPDAVVLDTDRLDRTQALEQALRLVRSCAPWVLDTPRSTPPSHNQDNTA